MPAYKDTRTLKSGKTVTTWISRFYCNNKQIKKRGFKTQREAKEFEESYLNQHQGSTDMLMKHFINVYLKDKERDWNISTRNTRTNKIKKWILPFFRDKPLNQITYKDIREWQNFILESNLSDSTMRTLNAMLSSIFNHAIKYYDLKDNPCHKAGTIGSTKRKEINFWTLEEYKEFISHVDKFPYKVAFDTLYYTGIRLGELCALTLSDFDFSDSPKLSINKNFQHFDKDYIIDPKTDSSNRVIYIPKQLADEILELVSHYYDFSNDQRIFFYNRSSYGNELRRVCDKYGLRRIRIHDLRHSHASLLINSGYDVLMVAERLGHSDVKMTLNIYSHLFPSRQKELASELNKIF